MQIPGFGSNFRLDSNMARPLDLLPSKLPPLVKDPKEAVTQQPAPPIIETPNQAPKTPVITKNLQSFSNLLVEVGVPNTPHNNVVAKTLASYGQPVNAQTINHINNSMSNIMAQNNPNTVEAQVVLLINKIALTPQTIQSVNQLLNGGGLAQNFLSLNKELKKMVDNFGNNSFVNELADQVDKKQMLKIPAEIKDKNLESTSLSNQKLTNNEAVGNNVNNLNNQSKVEESTQVQKNPFQEEEEENNTNNNDLGGARNNQQVIKEKSNLLVKVNNQISTNFVNNELLNDVQLINNADPKILIGQLANRAEKINQNLSKILTVDVLKNPSQFPNQVSMLKKAFAELEVEVKEFRQIVEKYLPEIKEDLGQDENIFENLLKLVFDDNEVDKTKKTKINHEVDSKLDFSSNILKDLAEITKSVSLNLSGREILAKNMNCMCLPLSIPVDGKLYNVEIMIRREDDNRRKVEMGHVPLKIQLSIETKNMGKVAIDMSNLKRDLQINLSVDNNSIREKVQSKSEKLQESLKHLPYDLKPITCVVNPKPDQSPSILLPAKYQVMSMKRIEGVV
ncbi:MAG: hypothetical protein H7263_13095 [Candidatus Sericytochromatia bacterium]|nr:hypothetical protein [Candidatus Sericytochromatia bacterium]